jgi:hypothetical protein
MNDGNAEQRRQYAAQAQAQAQQPGHATSAWRRAWAPARAQDFPPLPGAADSSAIGFQTGDAIKTLAAHKDGKHTIPIFTPGVIAGPCPDPKRVMVAVNGKSLRYHKNEIAKDVPLAGSLRIGNVRLHILELSTVGARTETLQPSACCVGGQDAREQA